MANCFFICLPSLPTPTPCIISAVLEHLFYLTSVNLSLHIQISKKYAIIYNIKLHHCIHILRLMFLTWVGRTLSCIHDYLSPWGVIRSILAFEVGVFVSQALPTDE